MSHPVITIESLGKKYRIRHDDEVGVARYVALRDVITDKVKGLFENRKSKIKSRKSVEEFWALKDVSFEVNRGEVLGIIGRNGAGKTTLLKILSRITEPTEGRVRIRGRVASLLEVGTGFHPELTGRENVFLNGAILGMSRAEIKGKFDEIVAFAEVEKFLDTPVKRYSSGMYVRLAFAVAAHLEPEILIVDEVLAVGDAQFQKKCLGRMHEVARAGRTVLFVSHNMGAINQLCTRAILLNHGKISSQGDPTEITSNYLRSENAQWSARDWPDVNTAPGDNVVRLVSVRVIHLNQTEIAGAIDVRQSVGIEILYLVIVDGAIFVPSLHLHNAEGTQLFLAIDLEKQWMRRPRRCGLYRSTTWIPGNFLNIGMHYASVAMSRLDTHRLHLFEQQVVAFNVVESSGGDTARGIYAGNLPGAIRPILEWETVTIQLSEVAETLPAGRQE